MITQFKIYESEYQRDKYKKYESVPYKTISLRDILNDCKEYDIDFYTLVEEIVLNKTIAFTCFYCYDDSLEFKASPRAHEIIGKCVDIKSDPDYLKDFNILVKIEGEEGWHELHFIPERFQTKFKQKVRIYNYESGELIDELEAYKNAEKYNL